MDYQAPVYDLLTAAARGRLGIDRRLLHAVLDRGDAAIPDLVRFAASDFRSLPINLEEDLIGMFRHLRTEAAIPFFVDVVRTEPVDVPDMLVDAVVELGAPALEPFLELYQSLEEDEAGEAAFILAALRIRDPRVLQILLDRLEYDVMEGALALGLYGDPDAIPALRTMLEEIPESDTHLRHALDSEIKILEEPPADHANDPSYDVWEEYPEEARPDIDLLSEAERLELLSSDSAEERADAARSFFNISFSTAVRARLLELARGDDSATVRARAWETLLDAADEPEVRKSMLAVIENPDAPLEEKGGALVGLSQHSENSKVRAAMEEFYKIPELRAKAMEAMWRSLDRTFTGYFPRHIDDPDREVQRQAIRGIGYLGIHSETKKLEQFFDDEDLRPDALFAYALSVPAEISPGRVQTLLRKIEGLAAGLSEGESALVKMALDDRLMLHGDKAVFFPSEEESDEPEQEQVVSDKVGRNEPCPCGSGKKYKKCCGAA